MVEVSIDGHKLTIDSAETTFDYEIADFVEFDGLTVVRLDVPTGEVNNRNVVGIDEKGTERWRIPESPHGPTEDNPYMDLNMRDGELWAGNWNGWTYRIDPETGELLEHKFTK